MLYIVDCVNSQKSVFIDRFIKKPHKTEVVNIFEKIPVHIFLKGSYPTENLNQICHSIYGFVSINYCGKLFLSYSPGPPWLAII
jgi:hypothetical protein